MQYLFNDLQALNLLIEEDRMEKNKPRIGAELELNFLDAACDPAPIGLEVYHKLKHKRLSTEYAKFNLEINSKPIPFAGNCLDRLKQDLNNALKAVSREAKKRKASVLLTGIIPTLGNKDITVDALTPESRFQALHNIRNQLRGGDYEYSIRGVDQLVTRDNLMLFAGCMTSFQIHLQVSPDELKQKYNWAQMISGPLLSCATYSPLFLGKRLWQETRVALFEQATDTRSPYHEDRGENPRVFFGDKWIEDSIMELFQEDISLFSPLLTTDIEEDSVKEVEEGKVPHLDAWNYYNGSIYRWNRVCYGILNDRPSLRIENRVLPSGPTMEDMIANAAFWLGMMNGMPEKYHDFHKKIPFSEAKNNFFKAARLGLDVQFTWFRKKPVPAHELIVKELLPIAEEGLKKVKIDSSEIRHYLGIIRDRVMSRKTGSKWIINSYNKLLETAKKDEALVALKSGMLSRQEENKPVHTWSLADIREAGRWQNRFGLLSKFMTTALYKVNEDDIVDLAVHIMDWKKIGHIPVENSNGELVGMITKDSIITYITRSRGRFGAARVRDIMVKDLITVSADTNLDYAINMILNNKVSCLPVVKDKKVIGIVTEHDVVSITHSLLAELDHKEKNGKNIKPEHE